MKTLNLIFMLISATVLFAQDARVIAANDSGIVAYERGDYRSAIKYFTEVAEGSRSAEVFFNLGNVYYKEFQRGAAVYNYERALLLDPAHIDASYNLTLIRNQYGLEVPADRSSVIDRLFGTRNADSWAFISIVCAILAALLILFLIRKETRLPKTFLLTSAILISIACIVTTRASLKIKDNIYSDTDCIVMHGTADVFSAPSESATVLFELGEGSKVSLKETRSSWSEVVVDAERIGWLKSADIARIAFPEES